jgi:hypothetical protein
VARAAVPEGGPRIENWAEEWIPRGLCRRWKLYVLTSTRHPRVFSTTLAAGLDRGPTRLYVLRPYKTVCGTRRPGGH